MWGCRDGGEGLDSAKILKRGQQAFPMDWMWAKRERSPKDDSRGFGLSKVDSYPTEMAEGEADLVGFQAEVGPRSEV